METSETEQKKTYNELTVKQKQHYANFKGIYENDEICLALTLLIEPRGENSFKTVTDKIDQILRGDHMVQMYQDSLYDNFDIGTMYTSDEIITINGQVRRDMGQPTYTSSIRKNCERDFSQLFIVKTVSTEVDTEDANGNPKKKKITLGYTPMWRLKPEE